MTKQTAKAEKKPETRECVVAEDKQHYHEGSLCVAGDIINLTKTQANFLRRKAVITENPFNTTKKADQE